MENDQLEPNPTMEEPTTKHRGWKAMPYIIGNETFEKLATMGTSSNLLVYMTTVFHMKSVPAAITLNVFNGTTNLATVIGAFLSDSFFGRYATLGFACIASLAGMFVITLTASVPALHPAPCDAEGQECPHSTKQQLIILLAAFVLLVIGAGGIRPCSLPFGADQFDPRTESGKKGINSFFNWYYFTLTSAIMISATIIVYIQTNVSWSIGFAVPTVLMLLSCAFFFMGSSIYVKVKPEGSPITGVAQVLVAAFKKRSLDAPDDPKQSLFNPPIAKNRNSKLTYTDQFRFLDNAAIITETEETRPDGLANKSWRLCSLQQVEEVKCVVRIIPIWSASIVYHASVIQQQTYVVFEALHCNRHLSSNFEIPAGSFMFFSMLALTVWIPIYDRLLVPSLRKLRGREDGITMLQRMGTGIFLSIVATFVAGLVEMRRRRYALDHPMAGVAPGGGAISSMSCLWLIPQLVLSGLSEAFNSVGELEFYYKQFPENMRSIAGSLVFCSLAVSNYLSGFMVNVVHKTTGGEGKGDWLAEDLNKGRLDNFYFLLAGIGVFNMIYFLVLATWYRYKEIDTGDANEADAPPV